MIGVVNRGGIGIWYDGSDWTVFKQDLSNVTPGMAFNVYALEHDAASYRHRATAANTHLDATTISHVDANNNPNAHIQVTHTLDPVVGNDHSIGVFYSNVTGRWGIFNVDATPFPEGTTYIVRVK